MTEGAKEGRDDDTSDVGGLTVDILLVPGFMLDADLWREMRGRLERYGRLVEVDTASDASIEAMADRAVASLTEPAVVIGFSMGGYVARAIAYRAPGQIAGLGLIATSTRGDDPARTAARRPAPGALPPFRKLSRKAVAASLHPAHRAPETIERVQAMSERLGPLVYRRQSAIVRVSDADRLGEIRCPAVVIASAEDGLRTVAESEELAQGIASSELIVLHGAGHLMPIEIPDAVLDALAPMLERSATLHSKLDPASLAGEAPDGA